MQPSVRAASGRLENHKWPANRCQRMESWKQRLRKLRETQSDIRVSRSDQYSLNMVMGTRVMAVRSQEL